MRDHPCHRHRPGLHTDGCLNGPCGFCGTSLQTTASDECRHCLRIVCEECDAGYQPDLGPICRPCTPTPTTLGPADVEDGEDEDVHRLCVFDLALSCGHIVTAVLTGWYPVVVGCCDRLGGTILRGDYVAFASDVDFVNVLSERHESRPAGTRRAPLRLIGRRARTDAPIPPRPGGETSTGRFPARVGATVSIDGSMAAPPVG
ncbi:hypothetical protein J2S43_001116 [Catenuloplanes nepalensis]|uniref:RING-type domain-containing protein n=1 Tax=Catenuloplanes nepalensis TaxID=587533 RepID=A0ABT9MMK4_9ACTN|nr:hypothetical protein [Catenuloplanes nepalensis]MDP9792604.1 hypothetical protein [Catenuloplanes nepalensis]